MSKLNLAAAGLCLFALLSGCGGGQEEAGVFTQELAQEILDSSVFTDTLDELDCDTAWALYELEYNGLERQQLTGGVIWRSAGATCEELALLEFQDESSAQTAVGALEEYLQNQIDSNRDYRPGEVPKLQDAFLQQRGTTVLLVVSSDTDGVEDLAGAN